MTGTPPYTQASPDELREQIRRRDRKIAALRGECKRLQRAASETRHKDLREMNRTLRSALSYIGYNPQADPAKFQEVARVALFGADSVEDSA